VDTEATHIGRRVPVDIGLIGDTGATVRDLLDHFTAAPAGSGGARDRSHLPKARERFEQWRSGQARLAEPAHDKGPVGRIRSALDNRDHAIRPEALAAAVDRLAADDAVFTPTRAWPPSGSPASSQCAATGVSSARTTSPRWPTPCPRHCAPNAWTASARWWPSAATTA
jgi:hypothetical protein